MNICQNRSLADINADGKMDKKEFSIAMHLIQKKLHGFDLPRTLPPSMKQDPTPGGFGSFGPVGSAPQMSMAPAAMAGGGTFPRMQQPGQMGKF